MSKRQQKPEEILRNWQTLTTWLHAGSQVTEEALAGLLELEMKNERPRSAFIRRIHSKYTKMRSRRERLAMLEKTR